MSFDGTDEIDAEAVRLANQFRDFITKHNKTTGIFNGVGLSEYANPKDKCMHCAMGVLIQHFAEQIPQGPGGDKAATDMVKKMSAAIGQFFAATTFGNENMLLDTVTRFATDTLKYAQQDRRARESVVVVVAVPAEPEQQPDPHWPDTHHKPGRA